jgi:hypothetical protein
MAIYYYPAIGITGGGDALDGIDGTALQDGEIAVAYDPGISGYRVYRLNATSGAAESSPNTIAPDTNAGNKRWIRIDTPHGHAQSDITNLTTDLGNKLNTSGDQTMAGKLRLNAAGGYLEHSQATPSGTAVLGYNGYFYATRVYNASLNDFADYQDLHPLEPEIPGICYQRTSRGKLKVVDKSCQKGIVGICTDTYGQAVGKKKDTRQVPIAVAGFCLAYVDDVYDPGTPLTNREDGHLTKMFWWQKLLHQERMVAVYQFPEPALWWGPLSNRVRVDGRHWVKVI